MTAQRSDARGRRAVLPVLALLFAAASASVVYALFALQDFEETCAQSEVIQRATRTRLRVLRSRGGVPRRGALVAAPRTPAEVRDIVAFCDTARSSDVAALREVALRSEDVLAAGNAVRALGRLHAVARDPAVVALVRDPRPRVRDETILALGESNDLSVAATLEPLARDADAKVRLLAIRALARLGGERSQAVARDVRNSATASSDERAFARSALVDSRPK